MFEINKTLLQLLKYKSEYRKLRGLVKLDLFDKDIVNIIKCIDKYWEAEEKEDKMNMGVFSSMIITQRGITDVTAGIYKDIILVMHDKPDKVIAKALVKGLRELEFAKKVDDTLTSYNLGEDINFYESIALFVKEFEKDIKKAVDLNWCNASIEDILNDEINGIKLSWRLACLQNSMPNLKTGQQIIVAARPGKGKTSFCADSITNFATQKAIKESGRPIVWFNNEGKAFKCKGACIRSALRKTFNELVDIGWEKADKLYSEKVGSETIKIFDIHGRDNNFLERIISEYNPIVVIWDMLDNVRGFNNTKRDDQRLEQLYQWSRECSVIYDFLSIATSQISADGDNTRFISDSLLNGSKTGKPAACDAIITIGAIDKVGFERSRFINIPKTKFSPKQGYDSFCKTEVVFDGERSAYLNPKV